MQSCIGAGPLAPGGGGHADDQADTDAIVECMRCAFTDELTDRRHTVGK